MVVEPAASPLVPTLPYGRQGALAGSWMILKSAQPSRVKVGLRSDCSSVLGERFTWGLNPTLDASVSKGEDSRSFISL